MNEEVSTSPDEVKDRGDKKLSKKEELVLVEIPKNMHDFLKGYAEWIGIPFDEYMKRILGFEITDLFIALNENFERDVKLFVERYDLKEHLL